MELQGQQSVAAPRQAVWDALNSAEVLQRCVPGCEAVTRTADDRFDLAMALSIGPLRARMKGSLQITEARPPEACTLVFEGQGGAMGFGRGRSTVRLSETPEGTLLDYSAKAEVGGKLAQVGSRLIDTVARKMADDFFAALRRQLEPQQAPVVAPAASDLQAQPEAASIGQAPPAAASRARAEPRAAAMPAPAAAAAHLVPGWWLLVAALLGSFTTLAGMIARA